MDDLYNYKNLSCPKVEVKRLKALTRKWKILNKLGKLENEPEIKEEKFSTKLIVEAYYML